MRIRYRRDREDRTDYRRRLTLLKSGKPRLAVRRSLDNIVVSLIGFDPDGDRVIASFHSASLKKRGWKHGTGNIPAAYVTGYLAAKAAQEKGVSEAILDIGRFAPVKGSRVFAALKGAIDAGLDIPHSEEALPKEERLFGEHIKAHLGTDIRADVTKIIGA